MNRNLTAKVKECAYGFGADLVGIAPISRFKGAPIMMSPRGILPTATNVVVCAIHHLDEAIELGGEEHPQIIGPYSIQYVMNLKPLLSRVKCVCLQNFHKKRKRLKFFRLESLFLLWLGFTIWHYFKYLFNSSSVGK